MDPEESKAEWTMFFVDGARREPKAILRGLEVDISGVLGWLRIGWIQQHSGSKDCIIMKKIPRGRLKQAAARCFYWLLFRYVTCTFVC